MALKWVSSKKKKPKRKKHFADYIIYLSLFAVVFYTIAAFVLQFYGGVEISATLTGCWYAFWTAEIIALATIKNTKTKNQKDGEINDSSTNKFSE